MRKHINAVLAAVAMMAAGSASAQVYTTTIPYAFHPSVYSYTMEVPGALASLVITTPAAACGPGTPWHVYVGAWENNYQTILAHILTQRAAGRSLVVEAAKDVSGSVFTNMCHLVSLRFN